MPRARASKWTRSRDSSCVSSPRVRPAPAASTLRARDFRRAPAIAPNYLSTDKDLNDVVRGGRLMQAIARTQAIRSLIREPIAPDLGAMGDAELLADFRARAATVYHPVSTCRMGKTPGDSVVDPALRVHGLERLRIVDASVFPDRHFRQHQCAHSHGGPEGRRSDHGQVMNVQAKGWG